MKKLLLSAALLAFAFGQAQVLQSENFNSLTVGNVGTNITGENAGQGGWFTLSSNATPNAPTTSNNAGNENFQVVSSGFNGTNGLLIQSPNATTGSRFMWQNGLPAAWEARTAGNNVIEVEYDFFTGPMVTGSNVVSGVYLYNPQFVPIAGLLYNPSTRVVLAVARVVGESGPTTSAFNLAAGGLTLDANTWYKFGFSYNTVTGQPSWRVNVMPESATLASSFWVPSLVIEEVDFVSLSQSQNTVSSNAVFDNLVVRASATSNLLTREQDFATANFSVFPNPANDIVNVNAGSTLVKSMQVTDMNGRVVKNLTVDNVSQTSFSIADLHTGIYLLSVFTNEGVGTVKLVKN